MDGTRIGTIQNGSFDFSSKNKSVLIKIEGGVPSAKSEVIGSRNEETDYEIDAYKTFDGDKSDLGCTYGSKCVSSYIHIGEKTTSSEYNSGKCIHDLYIQYKEKKYNKIRETTYSPPVDVQVNGTSISKNNPMKIDMNYSSSYVDKEVYSGYSTKSKKSSKLLTDVQIFVTYAYGWRSGFKYESLSTGETIEEDLNCYFNGESQFSLSDNYYPRENMSCQIKIEGCMSDSNYIYETGSLVVHRYTGVVKGTEHGDLPFTLIP